jgi:hypothetical protein
MAQLQPTARRRSSLYEPAIETGPQQSIRDLLRLLPRLPVGAHGQPDFDAAAPALLVQLAESAEVLQSTFNLGVAAIGQLLAHASPEIDDGTVGQDTVEALGWLLQSLGTGAAVCFELSAPCRRHTTGFAPSDIST